MHPRDGIVFRKVKGPGTPIRYEIGAAWRQDDVNPALPAFLATARRIMGRRRPSIAGPVLHGR